MTVTEVASRDCLVRPCPCRYRAGAGPNRSDLGNCEGGCNTVRWVRANRPSAVRWGMDEPGTWSHDCLHLLACAFASAFSFACAGNIEATKIPCDNCMSEPALEYGIWEHRDPRSRIRNNSKPDNELFCMFGWEATAVGTDDSRSATLERWTQQRRECSCSAWEDTIHASGTARHNPKRRSDRETTAAPPYPSQTRGGATVDVMQWLRRPLVDCLCPTSPALSSSSLLVSPNIFA